MKNINKFMILVGILLNFSVVNAEVKEIESLDQISNEIVGGKTEKKVNKEIKKEVEKTSKTDESIGDIPEESATRTGLSAFARTESNSAVVSCCAITNLQLHTAFKPIYFKH